jgi:predicted component of type VI protein secretion system
MSTSCVLTLIHQKTRQRYPLTGDVVIGRSHGTLIFDHDPKLSSKHCLIRRTDSGFTIFDLKSRTGIQINGHHLPADKACVLKGGTVITVGDQVFVVEDATLPPLPISMPWLATLAMGVLLALGFVLFNSKPTPEQAQDTPTTTLERSPASVDSSDQ